MTSELARYKINIVALMRPGWQAKESWLRRVQDILFFWNICAADDKHEARVGYAIKTSFVGKLACPHPEKGEWLPHDYETSTSSRERVCYYHQRLCTHHDQHRWDKRQKFYEDFEYVISAVHTTDKLIIVGDFNLRVGQDSAL